MAGYRNISVSFWTDSKVDDDFTPEDKYFYLYLMTNPHTSISGCYEISMKQMERETGYNTDTVKRLIQRMQEMHGVIRYCSETKEVLLLNWYKYNWSQSEKVKKALISVAEHIKHKPFKKYVLDMVSIRYTYPMHTTDTDTVSDTVSESDTGTVSDTGTETESEYRDRDRVCADKPQKRKRFIPPTVEEVKEYCVERRNSIDPQRFVDYYTANGWMVGRNHMKDWKATIRTWEKNGGGGSSGQTGRRSGTSTLERYGYESSIDMDDVDAIVNVF